MPVGTHVEQRLRVAEVDVGERAVVLVVARLERADHVELPEPRQRVADARGVAGAKNVTRSPIFTCSASASAEPSTMPISPGTSASSRPVFSLRAISDTRGSSTGSMPQRDARHAARVRQQRLRVDIGRRRAPPDSAATHER